MTKFAPSLVVLAASITFIAAGSTVEAGNCGGGGWKPSPRPVPTFIQPITYPTPTPSVHWLFGMSVQTVSTQYGTGLQLSHITPNGAARRAGLEPGDIILTSNGMNFQNARSNQHAVQLMQQSMSHGQVPAPTATTAFVAPQQGGVANLVVLDSRSGNATAVVVYPTHQGGHNGGQPAPAPTATF